MEFTKTLRMRRSTRSYLPGQITEEQLNTILDAAQLSPTGMGRFDRMQLRVVQNADILEALNADFAASVGNESAVATYGAPTVIFVLGRRDDPEVLASANAACVVENMTLAATELGLGSVYLMGICSALKDSAQAAALLRISHDYRMFSAVAIGIPAEPLTEREPDKGRIRTVYVR